MFYVLQTQAVVGPWQCLFTEKLNRRESIYGLGTRPEASLECEMKIVVCIVIEQWGIVFGCAVLGCRVSLEEIKFSFPWNHPGESYLYTFALLLPFVWHRKHFLSSSNIDRCTRMTGQTNKVITAGVWIIWSPVTNLFVGFRDFAALSSRTRKFFNHRSNLNFHRSFKFCFIFVSSRLWARVGGRR